MTMDMSHVPGNQDILWSSTEQWITDIQIKFSLKRCSKKNISIRIQGVSAGVVYIIDSFFSVGPVLLRTHQRRHGPQEMKLNANNQSM